MLQSTPSATTVTAQIKNTIAALFDIALSSPSGAAAATIIVGLYPLKAGEGSDNVPGGKTFLKTLPAELLNLSTDDILRAAAKENASVASHFRGRLALINGEMQVELFKPLSPHR